MTTVAELLIEALAEHGVTARSGGSSATRSTPSPTRSGARSASSGSACATRRPARSPPARRPSSPAASGSAWAPSGPGAVHLLNGLYDAKKSHAPVLAICGQVPREEMGSDFFQEVDNDALFADVAVFNQTVTTRRPAPGAARAGGQRRARTSRASRC